MALTKYKIGAMAFNLLDAGTIQGEGETRKQAKWFYAFYEPYKNALLAEKDWYWATTYVELTQELATPTEPNWQYQYLPPADMGRLIGVYDARGNQTLQYAHYNRKFYRNDLRLFLKYQRRVTEAEFPDWFRIALAATLAFQACPTLSGSDSKYRERQIDMQAKVRRAMRIDNQSKPPQYLYGRSTWIDAREAGSGWWT